MTSCKHVRFISSPALLPQAHYNDELLLMTSLLRGSRSGAFHAIYRYSHLGPVYASDFPSRVDLMEDGLCRRRLPLGRGLRRAHLMPGLRRRCRAGGMIL